ncbi:MAG: hypothetical protein O7E52_04105 [Candidatus Poribacteria bacterium]|nr:hypothetical protein [Candidatus Poribacteria bacterium]
MASNTDTTSDEDARIALGQKHLAELGIEKASIYPHAKIVRIQVPASDFDRALQMRETIVERMKAIGYRFVALDLEEKAE